MNRAEEPESSKAVAQVKKYYAAIDAADVNSVTDLFADNAVYSRTGYGDFKNKLEIGAFYKTDRPIMGGHTVKDKDITASQGIILPAPERFAANFPDISANECITVHSKGKFTGVRTYKEMASGISLPFDDYWVFHNDKVIYRYSDIKRDLAKGVDSQERF